MKAAEDFLNLVLEGHVIVAANTISNDGQVPCVQDMAAKILKSFIKLRMDEDTGEVSDGVYLYACDLMTLGFLWMGFHDAIREGDGERVMTYWKFFLVFFRMLGRKNYCIEAVNIQLLHKHHLSQRQSAQLVWSRFVNTHGRQGKNIPCDLHIEHLNKRLKGMLRNLGSNVKESTIVHAAKSIGIVHHICQLFEEETSHHKQAKKYGVPSSSQDLLKLTTELAALNIFNEQSGRSHDSIYIKKYLITKFNKTKYLEWVINHIY